MDFVPLQWIDPLSNSLYTYVLIYLLVGAGIYFTVKTKGVQVRYFGRMIKQIFHSRSDSEGGISSFQAFAVGLASRVGTGNIAGVAIALTLGGPGAIFWMWVVAALGMATETVVAGAGCGGDPLGPGTRPGCSTEVKPLRVLQVLRPCIGGVLRRYVPVGWRGASHAPRDRRLQ